MYFQTNVRKAKKSSLAPVVAVVLVIAVAGGAGMYYFLEAGKKLDALRSTANYAISRGTLKKLEDAQKILSASEVTSKQEDLKNLLTLIEWSMWVEYGTPPGGRPPAPETLDAVQPTSALPLVVARTLRDIQLGDAVGAESFVAQARKAHEKEPVLATLQARLAYERGKGDPKELDEAYGRYFKAMELRESNPEGAMPYSKALIQYGYAMTTQLMGNTAGAVNNFAAALGEDPELIWASVRGELAKISSDMEYEDIDKAITKMLEENDAVLSPLIRSTMHTERGLWALRTFNLDLAWAPLQEAARLDQNNPEPLILLGQLHTCLGKTSVGAERLEAARKLSPKDTRIITSLIANRLIAGKLEEARSLLQGLPEEAQGLLNVQLAKARIMRTAGDLAEAQKVLDEAKEKNEKAFPYRVELAMLMNAQNSPDAKKAMDELIPEARKLGMIPLATVLQAYSAVLTPEKERVAAIQGAQGAASMNQSAQALVILAKGLIDAGKAAEAKPLLEEAKGFGDMPQIEELMKQAG